MREVYANKPSRRKLKRKWNIETNSTTGWVAVLITGLYPT